MSEPTPRLFDTKPLLGGGEKLGRSVKKNWGPGDKHHPQSLADVRKTLGPAATAMREKLAGLPDALRGERVIIELTLLPNYLASSYNPVDFEKDVDAIPVGTRNAVGPLETPKQKVDEAPTKTLLLAATDESVERISELLNDVAAEAGTKVLEQIREFQSLEIRDHCPVFISKPAPEKEDELETYEAVLHPSVGRTGRISDQAFLTVMSRWRKLIEEEDGFVHQDYIRHVGDLAFMPVSLKQSSIEQISAFNPLRVLRSMPTMRTRPEGSALYAGADLSAPRGDSPTERIAVFDGGVADHPLLDPFVNEIDLTNQEKNSTDVNHGTLVTSALLYGSIDEESELEMPPAMVDHFRVLPKPREVSHDDEAYWVMDKITEQIERENRWDVVNLSYGPSEVLDEDLEPNRFTAEIDRLAFLYDTTFVVAAGNLDQADWGFRSPLGLDRIQPPADSVNAVGVGACGAPIPEEPVRAEYSRYGPGRGGLRMAPLGVGFGGDDGRGRSGFKGASPDGGLQSGAGTSYSAPVVARGLATLQNQLDREHRHVNVYRAFAAHFAESSAGADRAAIGYGRLPEDYRGLLDCGDGRVSVLFSGTLKRGQTIAYPLPIPQEQMGRISMRWTVSFVTPVDPSDANQYTVFGIEPDFRPSSTKFAMTPPKGSGLSSKTVDIETDQETIAELENDGWVLPKNPKTRPGTARRSEAVRREDGMWETLVRHEAGALPQSLIDPEIWLTSYERSQGSLVSKEAASDLDFAMLVTVEARKMADLYDRVLSDDRFKLLAPVTVEAPVELSAR